MGLSDKIEITQAHSPSEMASVRDLLREYAAWLGFSLDYQNFDAELAALPGTYAPPRGRLLLARVNGTLAGCGALRPLEPDVCEMKRLYVRPDFRGYGLGRSLAKRLIAEGAEIGYRRMRLDTIIDNMVSAIALYRSLGFYEIPAYYAGARSGTLYLERRL